MQHALDKSYYEGLKERNEESANLSHALLERLSFVLLDIQYINYLLQFNLRCTVFHSKLPVCQKQEYSITNKRGFSVSNLFFRVKQNNTQIDS